jgi:signal transduction histidine kinase
MSTATSSAPFIERSATESVLIVDDEDSTRSLGVGPLRTADDATAELAEIFRHEINNPLTGTLGNAELLLAHGSRFNSTDVQRLQTVVELAVRLRETIRRVSDAIESDSRVFRSF